MASQEEIEQLRRRLRELEEEGQAPKAGPQPLAAAPDDEEAPLPEELPITLRRSVKWGKDGEITQLVLKPNARALKGVEFKLREDQVIIFEPFAFAQVGLRMAGYNEAQLATIVDRLHVADLMEVAMGALGFIGAGRVTGTES